MARYIQQLRHGTAEEWATIGKDIVPLKAELVLEIDKSGNNMHRLKIGDGINKYGDLPYISVDNFILSQPVAKTVSIYLPHKSWIEDGERYYQHVAIADITPNSKVDLQPSAEQLGIFHEKDIAFVTENEDGVVRVFCIGQKPTNDYTMQATITEVNVNG